MREYDENDQYYQELVRQNNGGVCSGCGSAIGHVITCPLLNRETAEAASRVLAPYQHELNTRGTDCAVDCPACQWVKEQNSAMQFLRNQEAGFYRQQVGRATRKTPDIVELERIYALEDKR